MVETTLAAKCRECKQPIQWDKDNGSDPEYGPKMWCACDVATAKKSTVLVYQKWTKPRYRKAR